MPAEAGIAGALSLREARALALRAQDIGARPRRAGRTALRELLLRQAVVQLDSVNAVARTHELVPFSRLGRYRPSDLHQVVYRERTMFEYWGHAMSWVPTSEYRYFLPRMERYRVAPRSRWREVREQHGELYPAILDRIRVEGRQQHRAMPRPPWRAAQQLWQGVGRFPPTLDLEGNQPSRFDKRRQGWPSLLQAQAEVIGQVARGADTQGAGAAQKQMSGRLGHGRARSIHSGRQDPFGQVIDSLKT